METAFDLGRVGRAFGLSGDLVSAAVQPAGHINDTFVAAYRQPDGKTRRYIHQRINQRVFNDPPALMENIARVTAHIAGKLREAGVSDAARRSLTLLPAADGRTCIVDEAGCYWRTFLFIEGARTHDTSGSPDLVFEAARAFGRFQAALADLPGPRLRETIPRFHDTRHRWEQLWRALETDPLNRAASVRPELAFVKEREGLVDLLANAQARGELPERVVHNDTKLNNVLIDDQTGEGLCVIDLDTVMPGLVLHDFGDLVRTASTTAAEDERDTSKVRLEMPLFEALLRGYLDAARGFLGRSEVAWLVFSGKVVTLECGMRFLADHLNGDVYFKTTRAGQNLDRCRAQFALVASIEEQEEDMEATLRSLAG